MSIEENKRIARRVVELFPRAADDGEVDVLDEVFARNIKVHGTAGEFSTLDEFKTSVRALAQEMGHTEIDVHNFIAEGDLVTILYDHSVTFTAEFQGFASKGRHVHFGGTMVLRIENDKVVEAWINEDTQRMIAQLTGAVS